ncbi:hypothetical protein [Lacticaseibacillus absianus]|uniref:hypothetical protein n=1 Tax=Lacticaseibacillus absianus TaxID=2729623 RepID=UPI0015CC892C|nr:hypothetical protein [Lacticaseibacillus absianus]
MTILLATLQERRADRYTRSQLTAALAHWQAAYASVWLSVGETTADWLQTWVMQQPHSVRLPVRGAAYARRELVRAALPSVPADATVHLVDFDRLVTWTALAPDELLALGRSTLPPATYEVLGRTPAAWASHPQTWRETEALTNRVASAVLGLAGIDITAGSERFTADLMPLLLTGTAAMNDGEWPRLCQAAGATLRYRACEGLAYRADLNGYGRDETRELVGRIRLAAVITQSLIAD